ncbi:hypothetical protein AN644_04830 [Candidatus Epulonipiscium fishelsonii]|nr:hypothetical protein AN644_04830 [Epulopiscium sp. SCG-C06WGA-EpuloA1]
MKKIRSVTFWPSAILLCSCLIYSLKDPEGFYNKADIANTWVLKNFGWTYSLTSFLCLIAIGIAYFSPLGSVILGGSSAKPILSRKNWATITLCTAMASGALFWGMVEPIYHIASPPKGIEPNSWESAKFAMETMVLHWSIHPYSLYTLPVIAFAFSFFNMKKPFSIASQLAIITDTFKIKTNEENLFSQILDGILLFAMSLGILGSLGAGTLNMGGALQSLFKIESPEKTWFLILTVVTICFVLSSISGIQKGIKFLSNMNVCIYFIILFILFCLGPSSFMVDGILEAIGGTLANLPEESVNLADKTISEDVVYFV